MVAPFQIHSDMFYFWWFLERSVEAFWSCCSNSQWLIGRWGWWFPILENHDDLRDCELGILLDMTERNYHQPLTTTTCWWMKWLFEKTMIMSTCKSFHGYSESIHANIFHRFFSPATSQAKWNPSSLSPQRGTTWLDFVCRFSVARCWPWKDRKSVV